MAPSRRQTRSRTSSPYTGKPETRSRAASEARDGPATPKAKQAQPEPSSRHRYGLRSMLSNLIWGSPVKAVEEESEDGEDVQSDSDDEGLDLDKPPLQEQRNKHGVQVLSDDENDDDGQATQPSSASTFDSAPPRRFTAAEKGKGSPKRTDSYSAAKYLPQSSAFGGGLRSSQTFGDMRSIQRHIDDIPTSTPNTSISNQAVDSLPSPGDVNSQLASFFAAKGTASLTAEERRKISELLLSGKPSSASADSDVPTALTPNFSFNVPVPSTTTNPNISILSPAYKGLPIPSTTSGGLSGLASRAVGGLTGSQSLSSLSALANGTGGPSSAVSNPRSALNRRQARPLYLGAGYSSQAIARRKRVQAQMSGLYSNLTSFESTPAAGPAIPATPGKRRRVGEEAGSSVGVPTTGASPARGQFDSANAPPTFTLDNSTPLTSTPGPSRSAQQSTSLFQSAPHLRAQFAGTPGRPSPLRQAAATAVSTPSPPAKAAEPSPPRTTTKTADLMRGIVGDTPEQARTAKTRAPASSDASRTAPPSITMTRTSKTTTNKVPREELIKRAEPPSAAEILERSMPPELRPTVNGRQARPKPPPVPGSARKTRAAAAAEADQNGKDDKRKEGGRQSKENLSVPASNTRRSKSRSKTPEVSQSTPSSSKAAEQADSSSTTTRLTAGKSTADQHDQAKEDEEMQTDATPSAPRAKSSAFNFGSGAPPTPAPSFFGNGAGTASTQKPAVIEQSSSASTSASTPAKPMFAFNPPSRPTTPSASVQAAPSTSTPATKAPSSSAPEPAFKAMETTPAAFTISSSAPKDPKQEALKIPSVALPTFTLYDTGFSLGQAAGGNDESDDAGIKAIKQTVLEIPKNELVVFDLL